MVFLRKSLEDWPQLVMMLLRCGACCWVMDCIPGTAVGYVRTEATCQGLKSNSHGVYQGYFLTHLRVHCTVGFGHG